MTNILETALEMKNKHIATMTKHTEEHVAKIRAMIEAYPRHKDRLEKEIAEAINLRDQMIEAAEKDYQEMVEKFNQISDSAKKYGEEFAARMIDRFIQQ